MASIISNVPVLRQTLSRRFPREFFTCRQCLQKQSSPFSTSPRMGTAAPFRNKPLKLNSMLSPALRQRTATSSPFRSLSVSSSRSAATAAAETAGSATKQSKSRFPDTSSKIVAYWLLGSAASVFGIVVFGGLTRLTESGYVVFLCHSQILGFKN